MLNVVQGKIHWLIKNKDYQVDTIDYPEKLVKRAIQLIGVQVKLKSFFEVDEHEIYSGVFTQR
ncbi:hypothetical protein [Acinetobacter radioresistens]|uniref:hypothetical protein n=1 Tax=Acinetobacter radioresistens TaxID=40216 RepID=UPI002246F528|nr:hypothetical protein [Acinetobacter radioresistens]MCX0340131.1 hypothetical protein [Acinetobacter radioresistens]